MAERNRIARDLHDTMLQTIHASTMIVHTVRELPGIPSPAFPALDKLSEWLTRATIEARSSLTSLRQTESSDLAEELKIAGGQWAAGKSIQLSISTVGGDRKLLPAMRGEIFQIACEAIRNACRHSQCDKVEVELNYGRRLILRVRDNGKGIAKDLADQGKAGHFGLNGMRERAAKIGAEFSIRGQPGRGTEVELVVPYPNRFIRKVSSGVLRKTGVSVRGLNRL
jgi:signal transduction histidine kinase